MLQCLLLTFSFTLGKSSESGKLGKLRPTLTFVLGLSFLLLACTESPNASQWTIHSRTKGHFKKPQKPVVSLSEIAVPKDQEVCFSPEEPCDLKLIKMIQSAKHSIDIAIYDINLDLLVHELLLASKRIKVRIVVDRKQAKGERSMVPLLLKAGAHLRFGSQRGIMHNKFTIIDGKMLETGSFNYTNHASLANHENQIYLQNPAILEKYKNKFDELWAKSSIPYPEAASIDQPTNAAN